LPQQPQVRFATSLPNSNENTENSFIAEGQLSPKKITDSG